MACEPSDNLVMPSRPTLVAEAIERLNTAGLRSQVLKLDTPTLSDLGLWLTDREISVREAWLRLNASLGGTEENPVVDDNAVYRYAENFRKIYEQVRAEHARRLARLSVEHATAGNAEAMTRVALARLTSLVAEKLIDTENLEQLSATELAGAISTIDGVTRAAIKREELALKVADAERRQAKLEADLQTATLEREELLRKLRGLPEQIKQLQARLESAEKSRAAGKALDSSLFAMLREELSALAHSAALPPNGEQEEKP